MRRSLTTAPVRRPAGATTASPRRPVRAASRRTLRRHGSVTTLPTPTAAAGRLRVLVVSESFLPQVNGVTNSVRRVLEHLAAEGHDAELVAPTGPATYAGFPVTTCRGAHLPFYRDFRIGLETRRRLRAVMERYRPDVVHIASPATLGYQAARAANDLGIPTVAIYQTDLVGFADRYGIAGGTRAMAYLTRRIHTSVDRTLAPSTASLRQLEAMRVAGLGHWPRGVDLTQFDPACRDEELRSRLAPHGEVLVGYVGRLAPEKELELLAHVDRLPGVRVVIVGGGPEEERLRALLPGAAFLGVLHGEELGAAYASLDVFVHTGRHETYCQAAQEALASGVPVVAPRAGGPVDVVDDGTAGFLYEPGDGAALASYVALLAQQPALRRRVALAARRSVEGRSWAAVNALLLRHYREVVAARRAPDAVRAA
ncbi:glycosyltransferase family 1 protein [Nocardioides sp. ChNu-153]|uniref:glycosyltransferase family 4 protein n=1 Tax=unclassified Nocardioides TaxID=2615069 RepID=UPI002406D2C8|nr:MULTISPECIES: glycosyltransferase family 1 protein [unclassified Nocardioides]MDF9717778.1 glycosyltransferase family 1 protein [Nocardioides sp. ChNu-99]MDN7122598.1 glycosyltransferase family 1 protein [Nocardioides sp. ChNu-153]